MFRKKQIHMLCGIFLIVFLAAYGCRPYAASAAVTDISDNWAYPYINYLLSQGDIAGYPDGTFRPYQNISRAEFFTIINRAFNFNTEADISYRDVQPGDWYYREIARAKAAGYVSGYLDGTMKPGSPISRQEAAAIIGKVLHLQPSGKGTLTFTDAASIPGWSRNYILAMVQAGYMKGYPDGSFRPMVTMTRAETAAIIAIGKEPTLANGPFNVMWFGAKGNGVADDTAFIQKTIEYVSSRGGGNVYIPDGTYLINVDNYFAISLKSNTNLIMAENAILKAKPTAQPSYAIVRCRDASNVTITGGKIVGDRDFHKGTRGESGHGISVQGSNNVRISNVHISDCWGDGIYVANTDSQNYCDKVVIENFVTERNRRNGIAVVSAKNLIIKNGESFNNYGTNPQSGIDLEPYGPEALLENILVENVYCHNNGAGDKWQSNYCWGICVALGHYENNIHPFSVTIRNCRLVDNGRDKDNEQLNYDLIKTYLSSPKWKGTIVYSGITYR